ncbi:copper homeostasis protein CutC [Leifsonia shinshuensis]|uniref:copper homeostasis protein CutC n=1 Tax=Leifsonia shinshuensis TaxID=150026 RepID=UPI00285AA236|nr:copper homeostasis protein CutC [Leifsonia shinshuensis]MDR6972625.1 copper homeostasis protein [Leifsonia shinshuensis]
MTSVEICLDDLAGVRVAEEAGADRVELCAALAEGGITPSIGTVGGALRAALRIGIQVLIRQRPGDFVYDEDELQAMVDDIHSMRALPNPSGVTLGFVLGALRADGRINADATRRLVAACGEAPVTFHKAFDQLPDRAAALEQLVDLGVSRVLTSAGASSALEGADGLARLVEQAGDRIAVLAGGGIRPANAAELVERSGVREVHLRAPLTVATVAAGAPTAYDHGSREVTSGDVVRAVVDAVSGAGAGAAPTAAGERLA